MPLFKGQGCKSTPGKAIAYITREDKAALVSSQSLDDSRSYAEQFRETGKLYGKGGDYDERKYYHFKFSCDPADGVTAEQSQRMTEQMAARSFPGHECVIATHTDKAHIHSHIIVNAIGFEDGKKLHINDNEYAALKDMANTIAQEHGFTPLNWRKRGQERVSSAEKQIIMRGGASWKDELRDAITEAMRNSDSFTAFRNHLAKYSVTIERNTEKTISFKHPEKTKAIRGERLGAAFTKGAVTDAIGQQRNRGAARAEEPGARAAGSGEIAGNSQVARGRTGEHLAQRELDRIHGKIQAIGDRNKRFSPTGREELSEREAEKRRTNTEPDGAGERSGERQRTVKRKHERGHSGHDFGR